MRLVENSRCITELLVPGSRFPGFGCGGFPWRGLRNDQAWIKQQEQTGAKRCSTRLISASSPRPQPAARPRPARASVVWSGSADGLVIRTAVPGFGFQQLINNVLVN